MSKTTQPTNLQQIAKLTAIHAEYVDVLRAGGFVAFLPHLIDRKWGGIAPRLAEFPIALCATGLPSDIECQGVPYMLTSSYWFDPASYRETEEIRTLSYLQKQSSEFRVDLCYDKQRKQWEAQKYRAKELRLIASGKGLDELAIHFAISGIETGEPAEGLLTFGDVASRGVYIFTPQNDELKPGERERR